MTVTAALGLTCAALSQVTPLAAQELDPVRDRVNQGYVGIMCGGTAGSFLYFCEDLAIALNDNVGYSMRVVPMVGEGSTRNIEDILYLRGVDLGLAFSDTLDFLQNQGIHPRIKERIGYITAMHGAELHLLAAPGIDKIEDLAGKKVNFSTPGTGSYLTMTNIFDALGIQVDVQSDADQVALKRLQAGEIAAMGKVVAVPWKLMENLTANEGISLLSIPLDQVGGPYEPVVWGTETYPQAIRSGVIVTSAQVKVMLLAYNWPSNHPRCAKVERFADALRQNLPELVDGPYQPKWKDVDLETDIKGLERWPGNCTAERS